MTSITEPRPTAPDGFDALDARLRVTRAPGAGAERFAIQPYPAELAESLEWQGRTLLLRPIRPEDEASHRAFVEQLRPDDLRLRFFSVRRSLPRSELARLVQIDYAREMAFIALAPDAQGSLETLGVVRAVADPDNVEAEFAVIVRSDLKGRGLGDLLMAKILRYLKAHGTQRVVGDVLRENQAMRDLALAHGFRVDTGRDDADALRYVLDLQPAARA